MKLTRLFCLIFFISLGHMAQGTNTETTKGDHDELPNVQGLMEHVARLEQRLNDQNVRISKQEQTIREQSEDFMNRFGRQEKEFRSRITRQERSIQKQRKEFIKRFTQQEKRFMSRITRLEGAIQEQKKEFMNRVTRQEDTIQTLKKKCNLMTQRNQATLQSEKPNADSDREKTTPEADVGSTQLPDIVEHNENDTGKRSDDPNIGALEPVLSHVTAQITEITADIQALKNTNTRQDQERGTTFVRWGHKGCPDSSELIYTGIVSGGHYQSAGGAGNYLCLTSHPVLDGHTQPSGSGYASIYGSEYQTCPEPECNTTPACAMCHVPRSASVMVPGTNTCSSGWTKEYSGYIMALNEVYKGSSEYICVDSSHNYIATSQTNDDENLIYYVHARCGALPCPPYVDQRIVTCVVCTK